MDEVVPALYNWKAIEDKFTNKLNISSLESRAFFNYAAKYNYLKMNEYLAQVKEGSIIKANAQQYWIDKLPYLKDVYKFKYLSFIEKEKQEELDRNNTVANRTMSSCNNLDFSSGNLSNWVGQWNNQGTSGTISGTQGNQGYGALTINGFNSNGFNNMGYVHELCNGGTDPHVPINRVAPGHNYSVRLGDDAPYVNTINGQSNSSNPYNHQTISNTFSVTAATETITYWYAVALSQGLVSVNPNNVHLHGHQPFFKIRMYDASGNEIICARYDVDVTQAVSLGGFDSLVDPTGVNEFYYKNWTPIFIPLTPYLGQNVTITFETSDCDRGGHFGYAYVTADCAPLSIVTTLPQPCIGGNTILTAPTGLATYNWVGPGIVGSATGQVATANTGGTYSVTMTTFANAGQTGCSLTLPATFTNSTIAPVASFSATTACLHVNTLFTDESTLLANQGTLTGWNWDFGDGTTVPNSTASTISHTYTATGDFNVVLTASNTTTGCGP